MDQSSTSLMWKKLMFLYDSVRHAKTRQMLICCMGICIRRMTDFFLSSLLKGKGEVIHPGHMEVQGRLYECLIYFHELIKEHSSPSEPVNMRSAAMDSTIASGLLEQAELIGSLLVQLWDSLGNLLLLSCPEGVIGHFACLLLRTWLACVRLLEDEDDSIRQNVALRAEKCFTRKMMNDTEFFPRQMDEVIVSSFEYPTSIFGPWIEYFNHLLECLYDMARPPVSSGGVTLSGMFFDKEINNHHKEKLLICQICCCHIEKLSASSPWAVNKEHKDLISKLLNDWTTQFYEHLISFASRSRLDWQRRESQRRMAATVSKPPWLLHRESG